MDTVHISELLDFNHIFSTLVLLALWGVLKYIYNQFFDNRVSIKDHANALSPIREDIDTLQADFEKLEASLYSRRELDMIHESLRHESGNVKREVVDLSRRNEERAADLNALKIEFTKLVTKIDSKLDEYHREIVSILRNRAQ